MRKFLTSTILIWLIFALLSVSVGCVKTYMKPITLLIVKNILMNIFLLRPTKSALSK